MAFEKHRILAEKSRKKAQKKNKAHGTQTSPREEGEFEKSAGIDEEMVIDDVEALAEAVQKRATDYETVSDIQKEEKTEAIPDGLSNQSQCLVINV